MWDTRTGVLKSDDMLLRAMIVEVGYHALDLATVVLVLVAAASARTLTDHHAQCGLNPLA